MVTPINLNHDHYQLEFSDGSIKVSKDFIKKFAPPIEMIIRNGQNPSQVIDMTQSPLSAQHIEILSELSQKSFEDIYSDLQEFTPYEITDLLLVMNYLMCPKEYLDVAIQVLMTKLTVKNGCLLLKKIPKEGVLGPYRHQVNEKYKEIIFEAAKSNHMDDIIDSICLNDADH